MARSRTPVVVVMILVLLTACEPEVEDDPVPLFTTTTAAAAATPTEVGGHDWTTAMDTRWFIVTVASGTADGTDYTPRYMTVVGPTPPAPDPGQVSPEGEWTWIGGSYHIVGEIRGPLRTHGDMCSTINDHFQLAPMASNFLLPGDVLIECKAWPGWSH